jgi:hypothetical protein
MTARKDTPLAYGDVIYVLNKALEMPGLIYELESVGKAVHFKQRCNTYRKMLREQATELAGLTPGFRPEISYDILVISQTDIDGKPDRQGRRIVFRHQDPIGKLIDPETGKEIEIDLGAQVIKEQI